MDQDWTAQNIVVTGAASGLGRAICYRFAQLGARVHGVDLNEAALVELRHGLAPGFSAVTCDISEWAQVTTAFERFKVIDVLVNCAGITGQTNLKSPETDPADVERVFRVNFFGSYFTSKAALPRMIARGYGRVLHIASIAGKEGNAGMLAYSASKAAVIGMTKVGQRGSRYRCHRKRAGAGRNSNPDGGCHAAGAGEIYDDQNSYESLRIPG
jgi:3-oxoacyl-[acyl-carrier protein] reductase